MELALGPDLIHLTSFARCCAKKRYQTRTAIVLRHYENFHRRLRGKTIPELIAQPGRYQIRLTRADKKLLKVRETQYHPAVVLLPFLRGTQLPIRNPQAIRDARSRQMRFVEIMNEMTGAVYKG